MALGSEENSHDSGDEFCSLWASRPGKRSANRGSEQARNMTATCGNCSQEYGMLLRLTGLGRSSQGGES